MIPKNWPRRRIYSAESVGGDLPIELIRAALFLPQEKDCIAPCIAEKRVHAHLEIREAVGAMKGNRTESQELEVGVFATKRIEAGEDLGEIVGQIYLNPDSILHSWNGFWNGQIWVSVDSRALANELFFVNDFRGQAKRPNARLKWIVHAGVSYLGFGAMREIGPEEEVLIDYGPEWAAVYEKRYRKIPRP